MIEKVQRASICPMNTLQKHDADLIMSDICQELGCIVEGTIVNLPRIAKDAFQMNAVGKIQTDQMTNEMSVKSRDLLIPYIRENSGLQLLTGGRRAIIVLDSKAGSKNITQQRKRDLRYFLRGSAFEKVHGLILHIQ